MSKTAVDTPKAEYILEKGMEILWSNGYHGTSVNDIVKAADIPKGSFYFYFKSKEDFVIKALRQYANMQFIPAQLILEDQSMSAKDRLMAFYDFRVKVLKEEMQCKRGCLACNMGNEMAEHSENIRKVIVEIESSMIDQIVKVAKEAQDDGDISPNVDIAKLIAFVEDAGKGAMISMKEVQSSTPIDNHMEIVKNYLFK